LFVLIHDDDEYADDAVDVPVASRDTYIVCISGAVVSTANVMPSVLSCFAVSLHVMYGRDRHEEAFVLNAVPASSIA
jgi:hypothetical protein